MEFVYIDEVVHEDLDVKQIQYLVACLDRLPQPLTLNFAWTADWPSPIWENFVDALSDSKGIKGIIYAGREHSQQEAARFLEVVKNHPVISELGIGSSGATVSALSQFLAQDKKIRKLCLAYFKPDTDFPTLDLAHFLAANRTLGKLELVGWPITPALAAALVGAGSALKHVSLQYCTYAPGTIEAFANALAGNNALSKLEIYGSKFYGSVQETQLMHVALRHNRSLARLRVDDGFSTLPKTVTDLFSLWKTLLVNMTLSDMDFGLYSDPAVLPNPLVYWTLLQQVKRRLQENKELPLMADRYPMACVALSFLPMNLPHLPSDISALIARHLLKTDASAIPSYQILHMLALHKHVLSLKKPSFPHGLRLAGHPDAHRLAQSGTQALPLQPEVMRSIALLCIRHQAADALNWLVVHASKGELDLRESLFRPGEVNWLFHWTRAAPCPVKLRLDRVALNWFEIQAMAEHLTGNPALTSLSLEGCVISDLGLATISDSLSRNTVMVELRLSRDLIQDNRKLYLSQPQDPLRNAMAVDNSRQCSTALMPSVPISKANPFGKLDDNTRKKYATLFFRSPPVPSRLSMIAFLMRRNRRMQDRVPDAKDFLPDPLFLNEIDNLPDAS